MASASTRPRRCGFIICRSKNSARWPTGAANSPGPAPTTGAATRSSPTSLIATSTTPTSATSIASSARSIARRRMTTPTSSRSTRLDQKIEETLALGGTQILLQGGHHPKLTKQWYLDLLAHMKGKFPQVNIHGFSPSEFVHFREVFQRAAGEDHRATSRRRAWARSPAAAAKFWWTACASASRRSRR